MNKLPSKVPDHYFLHPDEITPVEDETSIKDRIVEIFKKIKHFFIEIFYTVKPYTYDPVKKLFKNRVIPISKWLWKKDLVLKPLLSGICAAIASFVFSCAHPLKGAFFGTFMHFSAALCDEILQEREWTLFENPNVNETAKKLSCLAVGIGLATTATNLILRVPLGLKWPLLFAISSLAGFLFRNSDSEYRIGEDTHWDK